MGRFCASLLAMVVLLGLVATGCTQPAASPTAAPKPAAPTAAPAAPTAAPAATKPAEPTKAAAPAAPTAAPAAKVDFPTKGKAITIAVPFAAGGSTDIAARLLAPAMEKELGTPVEVVNKAGAATQVANTELAKARPDGYYLGIVGFAAVMLTYLDADKKAIYTRKDFQPIANFVVNDNCMYVAPNSPFKNIVDLVNEAKAKPGTVKVGDGGILSNTQLAALKLVDATGIKVNFVHYDGSAPGITSLIGGHIDAYSGSTGDAMAQYKAGTVRVLGTTGKTQNRFFPDVKSYIDQGVNVYSVYSFGLAGPAGIPQGIVDRLSVAAKNAMQSPEIKTRLADFAMEVDYKDPAAFDAYWIETENATKPLVEMAKKTQ